MKIDKHLKITMTRSQLCDLMLAVTAVSQTAHTVQKWKALHDELEQLLHDYDAVVAGKSEDHN